MAGPVDLNGPPAQHPAAGCCSPRGIPQLPTLYGGYLHPGSSSPSNLTMLISRWNGRPGGHPYPVTQWTGLYA
ncbi:hypothetical protein ACWCPQ_04475 [Nocardia sp. NPDC001965]